MSLADYKMFPFRDATMRRQWLDDIVLVTTSVEKTRPSKEVEPPKQSNLD